MDGETYSFRLNPVPDSESQIFDQIASRLFVEWSSSYSVTDATSTDVLNKLADKALFFAAAFVEARRGYLTTREKKEA